MSFRYLTALVKTSITILNRYGECGHPCLVLDFSGNAVLHCTSLAIEDPPSLSWEGSLKHRI